MAAESVVWIKVQSTGLGANKVSSTRAAFTAIPTQDSGLITHSLTTVPAQLDVTGLISGTVLGVYIKALVSAANVNPVAATTDALYLQQGMVNFYSYLPTISSLPFVWGDTTAAKIEYSFVGIT